MSEPMDAERLRALVRQADDCAKQRVTLNARVVELEKALRMIADGSWNFGNREPGLTVMEFARRALSGETPE